MNRSTLVHPSSPTNKSTDAGPVPGGPSPVPCSVTSSAQSAVPFSLLHGETDFCLFRTADGSPTMAFGPPDQRSEFMHSTHGALSESIYNYGTAIEEARQRQWPLQILSVGLGLGYNELIAASMLSPQSSAVSLTSFESTTFLRDNFMKWLTGSLASPLWNSIYEQIVALCAQHFARHPQEIKDQLVTWHAEGLWVVNDALTRTSQHLRPYSVVIFDAFSRRTSPSLWSDELLDALLAQNCMGNCIFATYASTGDLKRCLKRHGFSLVPRKGHAGKRESTLAMREEIAG